jgi:hypothetical protein
MPEDYDDPGWPYVNQYASAQAAIDLGLGSFLTLSEFDLPDFLAGTKFSPSVGSTLDYEWEFILAS